VNSSGRHRHSNIFLHFEISSINFILGSLATCRHLFLHQIFKMPPSWWRSEKVAPLAVAFVKFCDYRSSFLQELAIAFRTLLPIGGRNTAGGADHSC
jgi:hypothetical protein